MLTFIAIFSCLSAFLFGYDLGLMGGALLYIREAMSVGDVTSQAIVGAAKLGAVLGTFIGGTCMLYFGRRKSIAIDSIFFFVGPVMMACAWNVVGLILGRVIVGLGIGISAVVIPTYLGEIAPSEIRGRVVELYEVMLCIGMLSAALVNAGLDGLPWNWRLMVGAPVFPAIIMSVTALFLPESPRWLVTMNRLEEALAVIHKVYTSESLPIGVHSSTEEVERELLELWSSVEKDKAATASRFQEFSLRIRNLRCHDRSYDVEGGTPTPVSTPKGLSTSREGTVAFEEHVNSMPLFHRRKIEDKRHGGDDKVNSAPEEESILLTKAEQSVVEPMPPVQTKAGNEDDVAGEIEDSSGLPRIRTTRPIVPTEGPSVGDKKNEDSETRPNMDLAMAEVSQRPSSDGDVEVCPEVIGDHSEEPLLQRQRTENAANIRNGELDSSNSGQQMASTKASSSNREYSTVPTRDDSDSYDNEERFPQPSWNMGGFQSLHRDNRLLLSEPSRLRKRGFWFTFKSVIQDVIIVAKGSERAAFRMIVILAFFNQAFASTAIINYAPTIFQHDGVQSGRAADVFTSFVGGFKLLGIAASFFMVDSIGRRPLLIWGSLGSAIALGIVSLADALSIRWLLVSSMCAFIFFFSISWAGVFWVLLSEVFSMSVKSPAVSSATAILFMTGAVADLLFLSVYNLLGAFSFVLYAVIAIAAAIYVYLCVPETKERPLQEIQMILKDGRIGMT